MARKNGGLGKDCLTTAYQLCGKGNLEEAKNKIKDMLDDEQEEGQKLNELVYHLKKYQKELHDLLNMETEKEFKYHVAVASDSLLDALKMMEELLEEKQRDE